MSRNSTEWKIKMLLLLRHRNNPAARTTGCLLARACFAVLSCKLRCESSSSHLCECSSKLLASVSRSLFNLPAMTPPSKHARPPDEDSGEDLERPVRLPRTTALDVDAVQVDGPVVVLSDQVEERGHRRDSWDRVKRRLRSAFDLLRVLFFVQVQDERVCLRLCGFIQPRVRQWSMSWRAL
jgi:hypothetical protein